MEEKSKEKRKISVQKKFIISLVVMFIGLFFSSAIMHNWGDVTVFTDTTQTVTGNKVNMKIYKPSNATNETPAPTIVFVHGWSALPEGYTAYAIELARRGFVVIAPDMLAHGDSDVVDVMSIMDLTANSDVRGVYAAIRYAKELPYVDKNQFGIAGHSAGGMVVNGCVLADEAEENSVISSVYVMSYNPMYNDNPNELFYMPSSGGAASFNDAYGLRNVGVYFTHYDHAFFYGTDAGGNLMLQQQYLQTQEAKSFVSFGADPSTFEGDKVSEGHYYTKIADGESYIRVIDGADEIHSRAQASSRACADLCSFFQVTFEAPNYLSGGNQVWKWYYAFSVLGFMGLIMSIAYMIGLLCKNKVFASLAPNNNGCNQIGEAPNRNGKKWFWIFTILNCGWALLSCTLIFKTGYDQYVSNLLPQQYTNIYAFWSLINGIFMIATLVIAFFLIAKKNGITAKDWGVRISISNILKTIAVSAIAIIVIEAVLVFSAKVLDVNFQCYMWGLRRLPVDRLRVFLAYFPMYLIFYIGLSVSINSAYYNRIWKEPEWVNDIFFAIINMIPSLLITVIGYEIFKSTGIAPNVFGSNYTHTYIVNVIPCIPLAVIAMRKIHKYCNNPYIPGIIMAIVLCCMQITSCATLTF